MARLEAYHKPKTIPEAAALLARKEARVVAYGGGGSVIPALDGSIEAVVDLADVGLSNIEVRDDGLYVGATVTLQQLNQTPEAAAYAEGFLSQSAALAESYPQREQVTLGGILVGGRSASPLLCALTACDAEVILLAGEEVRRLPITGFFAYREQLLAQRTLITEVHLPPLTPGVRFAYDAVGRTPADRPIVCAVARMAVQEGIAGHIRLICGGVAPTPVRLSDAEQRLERKEISAPLISEALADDIARLTPPDDYLGSAEYRREMARVLATRLLRQLGGMD